MAAHYAPLVLLALAVLLPCTVAEYANPCCPGSPYNGEDVKMVMLKGLKAKGKYSIFMKGLFQTRKRTG